MQHEPIHLCSCGKTFETSKRRDRHSFNCRAQSFIEDNLGEPFASYHESIMADMGGIDVHATAIQEDIDTELTDENVKKAALCFCERALVSPNVDRLLEHS